MLECNVKYIGHAPLIADGKNNIFVRCHCIYCAPRSTDFGQTLLTVMLRIQRVWGRRRANRPKTYRPTGKWGP